MAARARESFPTGVALATYAVVISIVAASAVIALGRQGAGQAVDLPAVILWQSLVYGLWIPAGLILGKALKAAPPISVRVIATLIVTGAIHTALAGALDATFSRLPGLTPMDAALARAPVDMLTVTGLTAALAGWCWRTQAGQLQQALAQARDVQAEQTAASPVERIMVSVGRRQVPVDLADIEWFAAAANYVVVNWDGREGLIRDTLQALETRLDARLFARIHRSTLANLARVVEAVPAGGGLWRLTMRSGADLVVSRTSRADILARLGRR